MRFTAVVLIAVGLLAGQTSAAAVDLIIFNANVRTMASTQTRAEAIAISDGEIVAVGTTKAIRLLADGDTKTIDAGGKLVLPGFNDAHVHFGAIGNIFSSIKVSDARSSKDFSDRFAHFSKFLPKGRWILGSGWDNRSWVPNDPPTRALIDAVTPDNPVFVYGYDGKSVLANSLALKLAGIDVNTKDPVGGTIIRDVGGKPTGVLRGAAVELVRVLVPADHMKNWPEVIETATNYAASLGVTSVQDVHSDDISNVLRDLDKKGILKTRVYDCTTLVDWRKLASRGVKAATGDAMVRTGCVKFYAEDEGDDIPRLESDIAGADKAGLQVAIHAIGPRPNEIVLGAFEKAITANGMRDRRFRVEHGQNVRPQDLQRFATSNIIASLQPGLFYGESGLMTDSYKKLFDLKAPIALGSDAPMTDFNPLLGIHAAVNGKYGISVEQAVRAYTVDTAFAEFQEKAKGTIEVGKLADIVILSEDIFSINRAKIGNTKVETTIVGGKVVFQWNSSGKREL